MRYSFISATLLAITSFASAQTAGFDAITAPTQGQVATVGSTLDIIWVPEDVTGTITITLLEGSSSSTLQLGDAIATGIDNQAGKFSWSIPSSIGSFATYGFKISLDAAPETFQYSFPFQITGTSGSSSSASASATGSVTSTMTVKLTMGTVSSTASVTMTSSSANSTTTDAPTAASNATLESATASSSSNISTTLSKNTVTSTATKTSGSSSASSTSAASSSTATGNAAVSNVATGSLALIGGLLMAFAL